MEDKIIELFETTNNNTASAIAKKLGVKLWKVNKVINKYLLNKRIY